jgi:hypothetical protein
VVRRHLRGVGGEAGDPGIDVTVVERAAT